MSKIRLIASVKHVIIFKAALVVNVRGQRAFGNHSLRLDKPFFH